MQPYLSVPKTLSNTSEMMFTDVVRIPVEFNSASNVSKRRVFRESAQTSSMEDYNSPASFGFSPTPWFTNVVRDAFDHFSLVEYLSLEV